MDGLGLSMSGCQSQLTPNPVLPDSAGRFFATPAIWQPGMDEGDWEVELARMLYRSAVTRDFLQGDISPVDFMDGLNDAGVDVYHTAEGWESGLVYI